MDFVDTSKLPSLQRVKAYKIMALQLRKRNTLPIEVQVFRLDHEVAIATLSSQVFV